MLTNEFSKLFKPQVRGDENISSPTVKYLHQSILFSSIRDWFLGHWTTPFRLHILYCVAWDEIAIRKEFERWPWPILRSEKFENGLSFRLFSLPVCGPLTKLWLHFDRTSFSSLPITCKARTVYSHAFSCVSWSWNVTEQFSSKTRWVHLT
jgi:hypothetical protein